MRLENLLTCWMFPRARRRQARENLARRFALMRACCVQRNYPNLLANIRRKRERGETISVNFYVLNDASFSFSRLYELMRDLPGFRAQIIVVSDVAKSRDYERESLARCLDSLRARYGEAISCLNERGEYVEFASDIAMFSNPYDGAVHPYYQAQNLARTSVCYYASYGYSGLDRYSEHLARMPEMAFFHKIFCENEEFAKLLREAGAKPCVVGYLKMDALADAMAAAAGGAGSAVAGDAAESGNSADTARGESANSARKSIIIAPHHTVWPKADPQDHSYISTSNFLVLKDFYFELAERFPEVDFIFRPHPILFERLILSGVFTREEADEYIARVQATPNMRYENAGEFFSSFAASSALIYDCISFCAEYAYTGKPQLFIERDEGTIKREFRPFGQEFFEHIYVARTREQIIEFVQMVCDGRDEKASARGEFLRRLMINYPQASEAALGVLLEDINA